MDALTTNWDSLYAYTYHSPDVQGYSQAQVQQGSPLAHRPSLAGQGPVPGIAGAPRGLPEETPRHMGPAETAQVRCVSLAALQASTSRTACVGRSLRKIGLSRAVSSWITRPNRASTPAVYEAKWRIFSAWCARRKINPLQASAPDVSDFLPAKFDQGLAHSTLTGYRMVIAKTIRPSSGVNLGEDPAHTALLHYFEVECPLSRNKVPQWDISLVLNIPISSVWND